MDVTSQFPSERFAELDIRLQLEALELSIFIKPAKIATYERLRYYVDAIIYDE